MRLAHIFIILTQFLGPLYASSSDADSNYSWSVELNFYDDEILNDPTPLAHEKIRTKVTEKKLEDLCKVADLVCFRTPNCKASNTLDTHGLLIRRYITPQGIVVDFTTDPKAIEIKVGGETATLKRFKSEKTLIRELVYESAAAIGLQSDALHGASHLHSGFKQIAERRFFRNLVVLLANEPGLFLDLVGSHDPHLVKNAHVLGIHPTTSRIELSAVLRKFDQDASLTAVDLARMIDRSIYQNPKINLQRPTQFLDAASLSKYVHPSFAKIIDYLRPNESKTIEYRNITMGSTIDSLYFDLELLERIYLYVEGIPENSPLELTSEAPSVGTPRSRERVRRFLNTLGISESAAAQRNSEFAQHLKSYPNGTSFDVGTIPFSRYNCGGILSGEPWNGKSLILPLGFSR